MNSKKEKQVSFKELKAVCAFSLDGACLHADTQTGKCKPECCPAAKGKGGKQNGQ